MKQLSALAIGVSLAAVAHGQVYRCTGPDGGTVFQDLPCVDPEERKEGKLDLRVPPPDLENAYRQRFEGLVATGKVAIGMTEDQARRAWGSPDKINPTITERGRREQWVYRRGPGDSQYIYVENGEVVAIQ